VTWQNCPHLPDPSTAVRIVPRLGLHVQLKLSQCSEEVAASIGYLADIAKASAERAGQASERSERQLASFYARLFYLLLK
jgi:hypothetical protein